MEYDGVAWFSTTVRTAKWNSMADKEEETRLGGCVMEMTCDQRQPRETGVHNDFQTRMV